MNEKKLVRNVIQCVNCRDIIESKHGHDFKFCKCGMVAIDGGLNYTRRLFKNSLSDFIDLSEWEDVEVEEIDI